MSDENTAIAMCGVAIGLLGLMVWCLVSFIRGIIEAIRD